MFTIVILYSVQRRAVRYGFGKDQVDFPGSKFACKLEALLNGLDRVDAKQVLQGLRVLFPRKCVHPM